MRQGKASFKLLLMNSWHVNQVHGGDYQSQKTSLCPAGRLLKGVAVYPRICRGAAINVRMHAFISPGQVPGNHGDVACSF